MRYRASKLDCQRCSLKQQCCPNEPARKVPRSIHEGARDLARDFADTDAYVTSRHERKKVDLFRAIDIARGLPFCHALATYRSGFPVGFPRKVTWELTRRPRRFPADGASTWQS
jgi:hypothetical protein